MTRMGGAPVGFTPTPKRPVVKDGDGSEKSAKRKRAGHKPHTLVEGFTLIEIMVVIGVTMTLSAILVLYGSGARRQNAIAVEQAKMAQVILRAKSLSLATYNQTDPPPPCGYGVYVDPGGDSYALFSYDISNDEKRDGMCKDIGQINPHAARCAGGRDTVGYRCYREHESYDLDPSVMFVGGADHMRAVLFRPPDPATMLYPNPFTVPPPAFKTIYLKTVGGAAERTITVTRAGQLTF